MSARPRRAVAVLVGAVLALNLVALVLDRTGGAPGGPASSSYATAPAGLAAYADLLARAGHPIERVRTAPADARLDPSATAVLLDPGALSPADVRALRRFVARGGRLVAGGARPGGWLRHLLENPPAWSSGGETRARPAAPLPETAGVSMVAAAGEGSWADPGEAVPALAAGEGALLAVAAAGRGRLALLAEASPLQNRLLAEADNAALGLALAGEPGRPVRFLESVHGYGERTGLAALPARWWWALGGLAAATLLLLVARGRRLGPPERSARPLPPPRRLYVESLAATLARTKDPQTAAAGLRAAARALLARRAGIRPDDDPERLARAARGLGLTAEETAALLAPARTETAMMSAARALARLEAGARPGGSP